MPVDRSQHFLISRSRRVRIRGPSATPPGRAASGSPQDEAAFDAPEPLDPVDEELDVLVDEPEEAPEPEEVPEDDEDDSDLPAFTVLLVDVLRESVR